MGGQRDVDEAPSITDYGFDSSLTNFEGMGPKLLPLTLRPGQDPEQARPYLGGCRTIGQGRALMQRSGSLKVLLMKRSRLSKRRRRRKPFYINLWPDDVHSPFWPPVDKWADGKRGLYHSVLQEMDRQLGKLFDLIRNDPDLRKIRLYLFVPTTGRSRVPIVWTVSGIQNASL